jgi:hypothetical protein
MENREDEIVTIHMTYKWSDMNIDFGVPTTADRFIKAHRGELVEMLEMLADRCRNKQYPFSE